MLDDAQRSERIPLSLDGIGRVRDRPIRYVLSCGAPMPDEQRIESNWTQFKWKGWNAFPMKLAESVYSPTLRYPALCSEILRGITTNVS